MNLCKLCGRRPLDKSVPFGYKLVLPLFPSNNSSSSSSNESQDDEGFCRYLEVGLTTSPLFGVDRNDIVVKLSDSFGHCPVRRGNEITLEMKEWEDIMDHREYIERYFANIPVIQRYLLTNTLTMHFETFDEKKCVCLTKETCEEMASIVRIPEQTMSFLFALSKFVAALNVCYANKVPYACYVFEKFLHIIRSSVVPDLLEKTDDPHHRKQLLQKYIRNHWFFDETSATHKELIDLCSEEIIDIILRENNKKNVNVSAYK